MLAAQLRRKQALIRFAAIVAVFAGLVAGAEHLKWLDDIENRTWDWRLRYVAKTEVPDPKIKIVLIDQSSIEHFSQQESVVWPWYRGMYGAVVQFLRDAGARAVAFDILFTEPSAYNVDDDQAFASAMKGSMPIVMAGALRQQRQAAVNGLLFNELRLVQEKSGAARVTEALGLNLSSVPKYAGIELPVQELWSGMGALGNVSAYPDNDGIYRHVRPVGVVSDVPMLGLPFALYDAAFPASEIWPKLRTRLDSQGRFPIRFKGPARTYSTYGIDSIILSQRQRDEGKDPFVPLSHFKDSIVLVGMDAPGLLDLRPTPLSQIFPGVEYNATVLDNIMHGDFMHRVGVLVNWGIAVVGIGFCSAVILLGLSSLAQGIVVIGILLAYVLGSFAAAQAGYWIDLAIPLLSTIFATLVALALQYRAEGRERRFLRSAFQQYVSGDVIEKLLARPDALTLGGERRELTMFFSDIAGFTSISEKLPPEQLGRLLNSFLSEMSAIILKHGGTLDKYVGDAIVAFWNAPLAVQDHAACAVRAALECQKRIAECGPLWEREFGVRLAMRIGLHTGEVSVGNFGSDSRFNYTILGDAANVASRLEGANKKFGSLILLSSVTARAIQGAGIKVRRVGLLRLVGKSQAIEVFEPFEADAKPDLAQAILLFEQGRLVESLQLFEDHSADTLAAVYIARIQRLPVREPRQDWNPVWEMTDK